MNWGKSSRISLAMSLITLALLLVYAASSLRLNSIHQLFHTENIEELHSAEKESDPCHKNIYHQQKETGCEHKSHITQNSKCPLCEYNAGSKVILTNGNDVSVPFGIAKTESYFQENISFPYIGQGSGRSPPRV